MEQQTRFSLLLRSWLHLVVRKEMRGMASGGDIDMIQKLEQEMDDFVASGGRAEAFSVTYSGTPIPPVRFAPTGPFRSSEVVK